MPDCVRQYRSQNGKEGVDGSSPSEGFGFFPAQLPFPLTVLTASCSCDVHPASTVDVGRHSLVEQLDRVLVAGEVAVVAVDHGQAGAHVAGEVEG
jgi:hypothetical protein